MHAARRADGAWRTATRIGTQASRLVAGLALVTASGQSAAIADGSHMSNNALGGPPPLALPGARLVPLRFADLPGWAADDHAAALAAFARSCEAMQVRGAPRGGPTRDALAPALLDACRVVPANASEDAARGFFEHRFVPHRVLPEGAEAEARAGFATAYFEPVVPGSRTRTSRFSAPLLRRPSDLVKLDAPEAGALEGFEWARRTPGGLVPYPDRAAIDGGAIDETIAAEGLAIAWLDPVDAFYVHIQGSARIALDEDGVDDIRVTFAAKSGHPYTAIGRVLVRSGALPLAEADMAGIRAWLGAHPDRVDEVLHANRSYIFFAVSQDLDPALGPVGAEGVPLTPGRSIAVDRHVHAFGLPVWIDTVLDGADNGRERSASGGGGGEVWRRLTVAQDTGSAILGPARADLFLGTGPEAGRRAGPVAGAADFVLLLPRRPAPSSGR